MGWQYNAIQFVWIITVRNPPPRQTPPYRQQKPLPTTAADGMDPTGMHSCLFKNWKFLDFGDILVVIFSGWRQRLIELFYLFSVIFFVIFSQKINGQWSIVLFEFLFGKWPRKAATWISCHFCSHFVFSWGSCRSDFCVSDYSWPDSPFLEYWGDDEYHFNWIDPLPVLHRLWYHREG